jgi:hypothetical protein
MGWIWAVIVTSFIGYVILGGIIYHLLRYRRAEFIRTYKLPRGLLRKLGEKHPELTLKDCALVSRGMRQFFIAYLMSGKKFVAMPSVVADDLWHEFILYTREYEAFCRRAFGAFLHHSPAVVLSQEHKSNEGLVRVWWHTCKYENIDPVNPTRLPLLFALDEKLKVPGGIAYAIGGDRIRALTEGVRDAKTQYSGAVDFGGCGGDGGGCGGD